jgi:hypothetical protein
VAHDLFLELMVFVGLFGLLPYPVRRRALLVLPPCPFCLTSLTLRLVWLFPVRSTTQLSLLKWAGGFLWRLDGGRLKDYCFSWWREILKFFVSSERNLSCSAIGQATPWLGKEAGTFSHIFPLQLFEQLDQSFPRWRFLIASSQERGFVHDAHDLSDSKALTADFCEVGLSSRDVVNFYCGLWHEGNKLTYTTLFHLRSSLYTIIPVDSICQNSKHVLLAHHHLKSCAVQWTALLSMKRYRWGIYFREEKFNTFQPGFSPWLPCHKICFKHTTHKNSYWHCICLELTWTLLAL